jgi:4-hydroxy-tetrahydrodipicolinate synthase
MIQAFEQGQVKTASQIHLQLFPLFKALFYSTNPIPVKAALRLQGWQVGTTRLPLADDSPALYQLLQSVIVDLGLVSAA